MRKMTTSLRRSSREDAFPGVGGESGDAADEGAAAGHHRPVLVEEVVTRLVAEGQGSSGGGLYLDGTVGGGGHAAVLLERCPRCRLLAVDRDPEALRAARRRLLFVAERVRLARMSFRDAAGDPEVRSDGLTGALLDLGVSSWQLDEDARGFTFRRGAPLDMRMDPEAPETAAAFLASASRAELLRALRRGDAPRPAALAQRIVRRRRARPLRTSDDLVAVLESTLRRRAGPSEKARLFQALRMHVNDEVGALEEALPAIRDALRPGAVLVVVSYHSVEDRIVKRAFRSWSDPGADLPRRLPVRAADASAGATLTPKPVLPDVAEVEANPRARSARLRAWRRGRATGFAA